MMPKHSGIDPASGYVRIACVYFHDANRKYSGSHSVDVKLSNLKARSKMYNFDDDFYKVERTGDLHTQYFIDVKERKHVVWFDTIDESSSENFLETFNNDTEKYAEADRDWDEARKAEWYKHQFQLAGKIGASRYQRLLVDAGHVDNGGNPMSRA